jgi:hypothetical protein
MSAPDPAAPHPARRYVFLALKIAVSIILLVVLLSRIDAGQLWATARKASIAWLAVALVIYFVNVRRQFVAVAPAARRAARQRADLDPGQVVPVALYFNNFLRATSAATSFASEIPREPAGFQDAGDAGHPLRSRDRRDRAGAGRGDRRHDGRRDWRTRRLADLAVVAVGRIPDWTIVSAPAVLAPAGVGRLLQPLTGDSPRMGRRIASKT